MSLNSFRFIIIFAILLFIMLILQFLKNKQISKKLQISLLIIFSYFFLFKSDWKFCICVAVVTVITYTFGILIEKKKNKLFLVISCTILLGILIYFKYANFFINSFRQFFGQNSITIQIIIPIGISFYIFSALSYLIDIFREKYAAEKNILHFALFISFFSKITAGPIIRGDDFLPQVKKYRGITWHNFEAGIQVFLLGLFKKIVLADHLGVFVDNVFFAPAAYNTGTIIWAVLSYSLQIYFDFSGYSDMAIGIAKILGFEFKRNFNLPYISKNISEFWKRWHISLSSWFQEYIYIPLGGSRKGKARSYINLLIVMLLSGIWHGAGWTFIVWGGLHGIISCINKAFGQKIQKMGTPFNIFLNFITVSLLWIVFRASSLENAWQILTGFFTLHNGINHPYTWSFVAIIFLIIETITSVVSSHKKNAKDKHGNTVIEFSYPIMDLSKIWCLVIFFTFCGLTVILGYFGNTVFIYGAF